MTQIRTQNAIRGPNFVRRRKQGRVEMIFIQRSVCWAILFNCAANQQLQPKKEGKLGRAKLLKQRAWIHSQTKHSQDMFYLQKIHSQISRMGKSAACLLLYIYIWISIYSSIYLTALVLNQYLWLCSQVRCLRWDGACNRGFSDLMIQTMNLCLSVYENICLYQLNFTSWDFFLHLQTNLMLRHDIFSCTCIPT